MNRINSLTLLFAIAFFINSPALSEEKVGESLSSAEAEHCRYFSDGIENTICMSSQLKELDFQLRRQFMRMMLVINNPERPSGLEGENLKNFYKEREQYRMKIFRKLGNYDGFKKDIIEACSNHDIACVQEQYQKKIASFESVNFVDDDLPDYMLTKGICDYALNEVANTIETLSTIDINNDGTLDSETTTRPGTAHYPMFSFSDSNGEHLRINEIGYEWKSYGADYSRNFNFKNKAFTLYLNEHKEPLFVSYVSPS